MKKILLIWVLLITGCSTVGNVLPISGNTYMVKTSGHYKSWSDMKASSAQRAVEFCKKQNKNMDVVDWDTHGVRGLIPQEVELTFKCLDEMPIN